MLAPRFLKKPSCLLIFSALARLSAHPFFAAEVSMSQGNKQQWVLAKRPEGMPDNSEVILQDAPIPETSAGLLLVKNHYISLDPAIRGWMSDIPNYLPPIPIGDPVRSTAGFGEGTVIGRERREDSEWEVCGRLISTAPKRCESS